MKRVLIVDDDPSIREMLDRYLGREGYQVDTASDSAAMNGLVDGQLFDIVILDLMLGTEDGLAIARQIRQKSDVPIIMLTAKGDEIDRIIGLEMGADDYLGKPFNPRELLASMKSVLRRSGQSSSSNGDRDSVGKIARFAGWTVDLGNRQTISPDNRNVDLTTGEFDLLMAFASNAQRVLSRDQLIDIAHGGKSYPFDRSIDIQVMRLRRKIEENIKSPALIKTVRGAGYMFASKVEWS
ncbi:MAG: response regulator [Alphaproteobacteria bacterium]